MNARLGSRDGQWQRKRQQHIEWTHLSAIWIGMSSASKERWATAHDNSGTYVHQSVYAQPFGKTVYETEIGNYVKSHITETLKESLTMMHLQHNENWSCMQFSLRLLCSDVCVAFLSTKRHAYLFGPLLAGEQTNGRLVSHWRRWRLGGRRVDW